MYITATTYYMYVLKDAIIEQNNDHVFLAWPFVSTKSLKAKINISTTFVTFKLLQFFLGLMSAQTFLKVTTKKFIYFYLESRPMVLGQWYC